MVVATLLCGLLFTTYDVGGVTYDGKELNLAAVPGDIPSDVNKILLTKNSLTALEANQFTSFSYLTDVQLDNNIIATIDAAAFCNNKISTIELTKNNIVAFPDLSCIGDFLKKLYLESNAITNLTQDQVTSVQYIQEIKYNILLLCTYDPVIVTYIYCIYLYI